MSVSRDQLPDSPAVKRLSRPSRKSVCVRTAFAMGVHDGPPGIDVILLCVIPPRWPSSGFPGDRAALARLRRREEDPVCRSPLP